MTALGTARWANEQEIGQLIYDPMRGGKAADFYIGQALLNIQYSPKDIRREWRHIGGQTDQHALVCMGPRGGKGTSIIVPNLIAWRGSSVVIDPKGENATITAARRGTGSPYATGLNQKVYVLDPFQVAKVADDVRVRFNPLDAIRPAGDEAVDEASRIADALVVQDDEKDAHWNETARYLLKGLILYVLSAPDFDGMRTLITVRRLLTQGDWLGIETIKAENTRLQDIGEEAFEVPDPFDMLWLGMADSPFFDGVLAGVGTSFLSMASKERESVLSTAKRHTEFIESPAMARVLQYSDFELSELKTDPSGVSIFLCLPSRYMGTHYRWLRMIVTLTLDEMERIQHQPRCGFPVLMVLDEFPGLRRMKRIEDATAQIPGFGVKLLFVVQSLVQLKDIYKDNWETFITSSGIRIFAAIEDSFTLKYLSNRLGQMEISRFVTTSGSGSGSSYGTSYSNSSNTSTGTSEQLHKRSLMNEDEIAVSFAATKSISLTFINGYYPILIGRTFYYNNDGFAGAFDPHPDHIPPPTLAERSAQQAISAQQETSIPDNKTSLRTTFRNYIVIDAVTSFLIALTTFLIFRERGFFGYTLHYRYIIIGMIISFVIPLIFSKSDITVKNSIFRSVFSVLFLILSTILLMYLSLNK